MLPGSSSGLQMTVWRTPNVKLRAFQPNTHGDADGFSERCQALNRVPSLTLAPDCFNVSFAGCTSTPNLPHFVNTQMPAPGCSQFVVSPPLSLGWCIDGSGRGPSRAPSSRSR